MLQGHKVFVVLGGGVEEAGAAAVWGERWGRDLPGLAAGALQTQVGKKQGDDDDDDDDGGRGRGRGRGVGSKKEEAGGDKREKMKIAWRYERLGDFGGGGGGLAAGSRGTKYVSFPVLSSLVHSEKRNKKTKRLSLIELLLQIVLFFIRVERGLTDRQKSPQRQIELCRCPPLGVKLIHHPPRHLQYSVILLTLQNG